MNPEAQARARWSAISHAMTWYPAVDRAFIRKMRIERVALNASALCNHAETSEHLANPAVQVNAAIDTQLDPADWLKRRTALAQLEHCA